MRRGFAAVMLLLLAVVHAPGSAQALVYSLFPDILPLAAYEPLALLVTGAGLFALSLVGRGRAR